MIKTSFIHSFPFPFKDTLSSNSHDMFCDRSIKRKEKYLIHSRYITLNQLCINYFMSRGRITSKDQLCVVVRNIFKIFYIIIDDVCSLINMQNLFWIDYYHNDKRLKWISCNDNYYLSNILHLFEMVTFDSNILHRLQILDLCISMYRCVGGKPKLIILYHFCLLT